MNPKTKEHILALEFFDPASGTGYATDTMLLNSKELLEISKNELLAALSEMERDGLVTREDKWYRSTKEGQIEKQKLIAQKGMATKAISHQKQYAVNDLVLAIAADSRVGFSFSSEIIRRAAIKVHLYEFPETEIDDVIDSLIAFGHLRTDDFHPYDEIYITGDGLQHYHQEVRTLLNLSPDEGILELSNPPELDDRFLQLGLEPSITANLQNRWNEMNICANSRTYLASLILLGSILEGLLLARLQQKQYRKAAMTSNKAPKDKKSGSTKDLTDWTLYDYIAVSTDIDLIPKSVEKHIHELRDTRNLVHPNKQVASNITADEHLYRISREVTETVLDALVAGNL